MPLSKITLALFSINHEALFREWQRYMLRCKNVVDEMDDAAVIDEFTDRIGEVHNAMMALSEYIRHIK